MKATTLRFSDDLWAALSVEAAMAGVSTSQFIREAALARAAAAAGARGEMLFGSFSETVEEVRRTSPAEGGREPAIQEALSMLSRALAGSVRSDAEALRAESQQARRTSAARRAQGSKRST